MGKIIGLFGFLAVGAALSYVGLTAGYRFGAMDFGQVFSYLQPLTFGLLGTGAVALVLGVLGMFTGRGAVALFSVIGAVAALGAASGPMMMKSQGEKVPAIHDITTDTKYPPQFVAVRDIRIEEESPNGADYDTEQTELQLEGYPDLKTATFDKPYEDVYQAALKTVEGMGMEVVGTEENAGRIEATATTFWWGFKDDMVVRVNPFTTPVEVDVRSKSRVGRSDLGANAKRIETFLKKLEANL
jgi:uncharacterized protein (DUF1499 family)